MAESVTQGAGGSPRAVRTARRSRKEKVRYNRREALAGLLFISPWIVGFLVFTAGAMIWSLFIAFSDYNLATGEMRPVGTTNFENLIEDPRVRTSLANTLFYAVMLAPRPSPRTTASSPACSPARRRRTRRSATRTSCPPATRGWTR